MLVAAAALAVLGLLAGCAVGPSQRPPVATVNSDEPAAPVPTGTAPPAPPPALPPLTPSTPSLTFTECTGPVLAGLRGPGGVGGQGLGGRDVRVGCATVPVGGGYATGSSASAAEVDVTRVTVGPAPGTPTAPIAVLGDPGRRTGTEAAVRLAAQGPADLLTGRTLYGVDVRGSSGTAVDCITPTTRAALDDADPAAADPAALAPLAAAAGSAARTCSQLLEDSLTDFTTATDADDLEEVRQALGAARLNAVGLGGGAATLARWAQAHPAAQGRLVLDALPDPTAADPVRSDARAAAARAALDAFSTECVSAGTCPLGPDPRGAVTDLVARLRAAPLPASPSATGPVPGREVTAGTAVTVLVDRLADPRSWPALATALASARAGDPAGLLALAEANEGTGRRRRRVRPRARPDLQRRREPPDRRPGRRGGAPGRGGRPGVRRVVRAAGPGVRVVAGAHRGPLPARRYADPDAAARDRGRPGGPARGEPAGRGGHAGLGAGVLARGRSRGLSRDAVHRRGRRRLPHRRPHPPRGDRLPAVSPTPAPITARPGGSMIIGVPGGGSARRLPGCRCRDCSTPRSTAW